MMILAGDVGGTYTRLALFDSSQEMLCMREKKFSSKTFSGLEEIVREFLGSEKVSTACFGVAGPVREDRCVATNLPWVIDAKELSKQLQITSVHLLNDLEANAYGIRMLKQEELALIYPGSGPKIGNQALIAAGTGLGEAGLYWNGKEQLPFASEGGHSDFAPRDPLEIELFLYLQKKFGHVSYERVVSGPGLVNLYQFLLDTRRGSVNASIQEEMLARNPGSVISEHGRLNKDETATKAVDWFLSLYGSEAGNLALKYLALGGVYLGGGIVPHLIDRIQSGLFYDSFVQKGRFKDLLSSIPIWVILNDRAALLGAGYLARRSIS
ncbi:MAG: glucokinase [Chlamydiales bacterium]|nr:glucokinase [Chlamydiales bacterium]